MKNGRRQRSVDYLSAGPSVSPFASPEHWKIANFLGLFGLFGLIKSGISAEVGDPKAWYDRVIRAVGGIVLVAALCWGLIAAIMEAVSR